jgi:Cu+-exporting ATPase
MVGTGRGARMGVLFKNAEALENLHHIDTVVLDKTGTLTAGKPSVTDIISHGIEAEELLRIAASIEKQSEHPFAKAIMEKAENIRLYDVFQFQTLPGKGVSGIINNTKYYGGNRKLMEECGIAVPDYLNLADEGKTPLYFADETGKYLGVIAAADVLKSDSEIAIKKLQEMQLDVIMLTGDNGKTAKAIAGKAGIRHVISDVMPTDKAAVIEKLRGEGHRVLMVGDGINDAPALALADVGMAISSGTDIAMESADVVLMNNSLQGIVNAVSLSKATIRNIRQNLFWAFFYNCLGIPVAAGVLYPACGILLSPMIGSAAMSLSSFFVVTNALRLRFFKSKCVEVQEEKSAKKEVTIMEEKLMETIIKVNGMMCPHCKARVESVCKAVEGAADAVVDLQLKQVTVTGNASVDALKKAITDAGYEVVG